MTKDELRKKFNQDVENARKTQGAEAIARLTSLGKELYETPEEDLDKFIDEHFDELKSLPASGSDFRSYKKLEGRPGLASAFGYGGDAKGVDALFGNGRRSWKSYDDNTLNTIAKVNGFGSLPEMKEMLGRMQAEYDKEKQEERSAKMAEDIRKARAQVVEEEMNPKFNEHPIDWFGMKVANAFIPNIVESAREDALKGVGTSEGYLKNLVNFAADHPKDVAADALISGASFVPVGKIVSGKYGLGKTGRVVIEGIHQGANAAAGEYAGNVLHDKEFDWSAVPVSFALGSWFETLGKQAGDAVKKSLNGKDSKTAKELADSVEDAFTNKKEAAQEYVSGLKDKASKYETPDNPGRNDYVMTNDNFDMDPITAEDVKKAKEAEELFDYIETGKRPQTQNKEQLDLSSFDEEKYTARDMTDKEISEALSRHPVLKEYKGEALRDAAGGKKRKIGKALLETARDDAAPVIKAFYKFTTSKDDREHQQKKKQERLEAKWMAGEIPVRASDPEWKEFQEWSTKNPDKFQQAKLLALR